MRIVRLILLFGVLLNFYSCNDAPPYPQSLITANQLTYTHPDSAIVFLNSIKDSIQKAPESTQMYYRLLCIKANDKAYILHKSDSLILPVLDYYVRKQDKNHLPEAYYYAGRMYMDLENAPGALDHFYKALEIAPDNDPYSLKSYIYSQIGTLFLYQYLYDEALDAFKKEYTILNRGNESNLEDSIGMVYALRDIGSVYKDIKKLDSSLYYYKSAYDLGKKLNRLDLTNMIQSQIGNIYIKLGEYDSAKIAMKDALTDIELPNKSAIYTIAAKLYYKTGMIDSAVYYNKSLLDVGTIYAKEDSHRFLAEIAVKEGNNELAVQHFRAENQCTDSIQKINYTERLHRMNTLYNYTLAEKRNEQLKSESQKKSYYIVFGLIGFVATIVFFFIYDRYNKLKKQELKYQLQKVQDIKTEIYKKSTQFIEDNNLRIKKLEDELDNVHYENDILKKELQVQKDLLRQEVYRAEIEKSKQLQSQKKFSDSDIFRLLKSRLLNPRGYVYVTDEEWLKIENIFKELYSDFLGKLNNIRTLSDFQLHVSILIKAGFCPADISKLTNRSAETISSTRRRLYNKVFQTQGAPEDWDKFIFSL
ncbi:MAG: amino acid ABC transporter permease [Culturomica sp.]|jgi:tetratricopeptide (TPR) repeat protein|nr:amino acid ABC transporter permease [Culturomica sp.]